MKALHLKLVEGSLSNDGIKKISEGVNDASQSLLTTFVSLETELPEPLYSKMREFIGANPKWDQYSLMSSALAKFLFQNECGEMPVSERHLGDLLSGSDE